MRQSIFPGMIDYEKLQCLFSMIAVYSVFVFILLVLFVYTGHSACCEKNPSGVTSSGLIGMQELSTSRERISLDGIWEFSYDPDETGEKEAWFKGTVRLPEQIRVPGCSQAEKYESAGELKPTSELKYACKAPGWYKKVFTVPAEWGKNDIWLHLGGIKPAASVWINGEKIGETITSRSPVRSNITCFIRTGEENTVVIKVFWPEGPRLDGVFDLAAWSGLYRSVWIEAVPDVYINDIHVLTAISPPGAVVNCTISGNVKDSKNLKVKIEIDGLHDGMKLLKELRLDGLHDSDELAVDFDMPGAILWHTDSPNLYLATVGIYDGKKCMDRATVRFGLREIKTDGNRIMLNAKPVMLRGGCDDHIYPETICPPASKDFYLELLKKAKKYGFNYTKSCIDVFTHEYLDAADEIGYMVCQEMPFGLLGDYRLKHRFNPDEAYAKMYRLETANIVKAYRNHPSVIIHSMASEMRFWKMSDISFDLFCRELPQISRTLNPAALVFDITGTGNWSLNTSHGVRDTDLIEDNVGTQKSQEPLTYPIPGDWQVLTKPFILHEYCWWTSLPDPSLAGRYTDIPYAISGVPNLVNVAEEKGMTDQLPLLVKNSQRLKHRLVKNGLESARRMRHPGISGYHFWLIAGFPWAPEGVFNEFWDEPEDLSADEFRAYNGDTVLLLDDDNRRSYRCGERTVLGIEVSHFGKARIEEPVLMWRLIKEKETVLEGNRKLDPIDCGELTVPCNLILKMPDGDIPVQYELEARLYDNGGREICFNHWNVWTYPEQKEDLRIDDIATDIEFLSGIYPGMKRFENEKLAAAKVVATDHIDDDLTNYIISGGRVVLFSNNVLREFRPGSEYAPGDTLSTNPWHRWTNLYRTPPWNAGEGNMGTVIRCHPVLGDLVHEGWCDLNFVRLISGIYPMSLEIFYPTRIDPIIRSTGSHYTFVDKAYLFEIGVGKGSLLATSLDFKTACNNKHPLACYLVTSMLAYASGELFKPETTITREQLISALSADTGSR